MTRVRRMGGSSTAPAPQGALPPNYGGGALCGRNPQLLARSLASRLAAGCASWGGFADHLVSVPQRPGLVTCKSVPSGQNAVMASYAVNPDAVARARQLIDSRQIVLDSDWGEVQPGAAEQNAFLESHSWEEYAQWHLGLTEGASDQTKARYAFVYGDFRRVHRMGIIACQYRAAEWRHKEIELAAHELLQRLDNRHS